MSEFTLRVNGTEPKIEVAPDTPLLSVLRDTLELTGTKYGCGAGLCGACTVHLDGEATRSCITPVSAVAGRAVTTIEGLSQTRVHPLQQAWIAEDVPQCGYCQSGQIMQAAAFLAKTPHPSEQEIVEAMTGNLCRCGTYHRIRRAGARAASSTGGAQCVPSPAASFSWEVRSPAPDSCLRFTCRVTACVHRVRASSRPMPICTSRPPAR